MALSFRDVDNALRSFPGATAVAVSRVDYAAFLAATEPDKNVPGHNKHIEYTSKTPSRGLVKVFVDPTLASGVLYVCL